MKHGTLGLLLLSFALLGCTSIPTDQYGGCGQRYLEDGTLVSNEGYPTISVDLVYTDLMPVEGAKVQVFREAFDIPIETKYSEHGLALLDLHGIVDECVDVVITKEGYQTITRNVCVGYCSVDTGIDVTMLR